MKKLLSILATSTMLTSAAIAGSVVAPVIVDVEPVAMAAAPNWAGLYLGATYGLGLGGDLAYDYEGSGNEFDSLEPGSSYGAFVGYNMQNNNLVYGGEVAYSAVDVPGFGPIGYPLETFNYFVDGKARVGYAMNSLLIYGFVGYSMSNFEFESGNNFDVSGMNYGAGVDMMVGENMFVGAEYIARNLSGETGYLTETQTTNIQAFQVRAGWKF